MTVKIVRTDTPLLLVGGGEADSATVRCLHALAPEVVAVDSGAATALAAGVMPRAVVGDMDSLDPETRAQIDPARIHTISEQVSTDFDKALRSVVTPLVLGAGFMGARRDHELANYNALVRHAHRPCILVGGDEIVMLAPPDLHLDLAAGTRVSLFPMRPVRGHSHGLRWPIDGIDFAPHGRVGTSNMATGPVRLTFDEPGMLLILPRSALDLTVRVVLALPGWWPAP
ncbi:thiamine diphosphokinase [Lutimaribacter sp. EGI FJ00015]|uniref:Thiamine diphosphokinase n=1 Tax=Lutimaribacter degradans TaxID=2945989 RepID=A0ACC5ZSZ0_9RHOB|nr:thiamine diphosphokinase [Lutimaribacter sp. EGI FJ00013]MCM2561416.1 thiamine diphosphokinase [Lutimaribacter sp. EGI FJ00013]MCO0612874.1 thiamine diphosphokinase [Lutimaribacter sp. EGI FJ00015]MCO0635532.1 thiamine diphosphokinase [Lutimaribacter sp. EGI FJ00014]